MGSLSAVQPPPSEQSAQAVRRARAALPFDPVLLVAALGLMTCSILAIDSGTSGDIEGDPDFYVKRQLAYFTIGLLAAVAVSRFDVSRLRDLKWVAYGTLWAAILAVAVLGSDTRGSKRAIDLGVFQFQASELGKVLLVVFLSAFVVDRARDLGSAQLTLRVLALAAAPTLLVLGTDLGSGLVYVAITLVVLFIAGAPWRHFAVIGTVLVIGSAGVLVAAPAAGVDVLKPYQMDRLTSFLNPTEDPREQGYQQTQSKIAIGAGQRTGRGERATQTKLNFLPEHHTDFVFAVVGETWGFGGAALVMSLYALLLWRAIRIVTMGKDLMSTLVAAGVVGMLLFQVFVNVGMNLGIMPITGITLPLLSYGGSSVIATLIALGLLQAIYAQGKAAQAVKGRALLL